jgi:hypothetical protein
LVHTRPGLDAAAEAVAGVCLAAPHTGAEAIKRVIGDGERVGFVLERRHGDHRSEDLFLEDAHLVVALQDRRLDVIAAGKIAAEIGCLAADQHFGAFLAADVEIGENFLFLLRACLRADHRGRVQRVALLDLATRFRARSMKRS